MSGGGHGSGIPYRPLPRGPEAPPTPNRCPLTFPTLETVSIGRRITYDLKPLSPSSNYVKLKVGGSLLYTPLQTLTKQDPILKTMFSGHTEVLTDSEGWVLIDRSGQHFVTILNYLQDGSVPLPESPRELGELLGEVHTNRCRG